MQNIAATETGNGKCTQTHKNAGHAQNRQVSFTLGAIWQMKVCNIVTYTPGNYAMALTRFWLKICFHLLTHFATLPFLCNTTAYAKARRLDN